MCSAVVVCVVELVIVQPMMCCAVDIVAPIHTLTPMYTLIKFQSTSFQRVSLGELLTPQLQRQVLHTNISIGLVVHLFLVELSTFCINKNKLY